MVQIAVDRNRVNSFTQTNEKFKTVIVMHAPNQTRTNEKYNKPSSTVKPMRMSFNKTRHQHMVGEGLVQLILTPPDKLLQAAHTQDGTVAHRDVRAGRVGWIHSVDQLGLIDGDRHNTPL